MIHTIKNQETSLFTIVYENSGKETIILLHGGPGFPSELKEVAELLHQNYQVVIFHQRGTRKSPCLNADYSMTAYVSDIDCIASYVGLNKFHLWGHSWGGLLAQIYADKNESRLLSLFLCCPGSGTGNQWKQTENEVMQLNKSKCSFWEWTMMGINNLLGILGSDKAYQRLFKQVMKNYNHGFAEIDTNGIDFDNLKAEPINKTRPEILKYPLLKPQLNSPYAITIVYGDNDIYKSSKDYVIDRYPSAQLQIISNCGHIPWLHNPTEYNQILKQHYQL